MDGLSRGIHAMTAARGRVLYAGGMATAQVVPRDNQPLCRRLKDLKAIIWIQDIYPPMLKAIIWIQDIYYPDLSKSNCSLGTYLNQGV